MVYIQFVLYDYIYNIFLYNNSIYNVIIILMKYSLHKLRFYKRMSFSQLHKRKRTPYNFTCY